MLLLIFALVWTLFGIVRRTLHAGDGLVGEYFTNLTWSGSPAFSNVVNARIVEWGLWTFAILTALAALRYVRVGLKGRQEAVVPLFIFVMILFTPWAIGSPFYKAIELTVRDLNRTALGTLAHFEAFQTNINTPQTGEYVVGARVEEMLAMLRGHGVERYWISDSIAENSWVLQQIVASGWPRKLEKDAKTGFVLNAEPVNPACRQIEKRQDVTLVSCP